MSVRWANLLSNKIDSFIHRDVEVSSTVDPETATVTQKVTVTVRNDAPPSGCYPFGNQLGLPVGTSQDILALYSPHQLDSVSIDGEPIGSATESEFGGPVYSLVVEVPPGESRTVVFELHGAVPAGRTRSGRAPGHGPPRPDDREGRGRPGTRACAAVPWAARRHRECQLPVNIATKRGGQ